MHRAAVVPLIALLCWPLLVQASEFDLPELGVRLTNLPSAVAKPQVSAGSDVAEPAYRAQLDRRYQGGVESKTLGAPTSVGGHSAWTVVDAHSGSAELTHYTCLTYVI